MADLDSAINRSIILSDRITRRTDVYVRSLVDQFDGKLDFEPIEDLMISRNAWNHVVTSNYEPRQVFAHPVMLMAVPETSAYYRNMAMLPLKRVSDLAVGVESWESPTKSARVTEERATKVAHLYNVVNCSIIEGRTDWTLQNGYRNMIANMGIGLDGTMRNIIGQDADNMVKTRVFDWLTANGLVIDGDPFEDFTELAEGYSMRYGSEPDIEFWLDDTMVASVEVKGGRDPAGALERLGAATKSFDNTPSSCVNFLVAGVITAEMQRRLDAIGTIRVFTLDDVIRDGVGWYAFLNEVFHHVVRITDSTITGE
ncbi:MAG: XcyI family restriction endonuclease [Chloroflexi bacterium]|nr:XcyI family restriction endonuclease [Chloroflexota bacterium]